MKTIYPYLNFNGTAEEAFNLYKSVFGGEFSGVYRFSEMPDAGELTESDGNKIMHISLPLNNGNALMGSDLLESMGQQVTPGNNAYLFISADSKEEADLLFNGLSEGGTIEMPMQDVFWGAYYGSFADRFGIQWMISYEYPQTEFNI